MMSSVTNRLILKGRLPAHFDASNLFNVFMICVIGAMMWEAKSWNMHAKIVPMIVGSLAMFFAAASLLNAIFRKSDEHVATGLAAQVEQLARDRQEDRHGHGDLQPRGGAEDQPDDDTGQRDGVWQDLVFEIDSKQRDQHADEQQP